MFSSVIFAKNGFMIDVVKVEKELYLKRISHDDANDVYNLIDNNRNFLKKWLPFIDETHSAENTHAFVDHLQRPFTNQMVFTIVFEDEIAGLIGFKDIDSMNRRLEIGYWIGEKYQHKGIVVRSCRALIKKAFSNMNINRISIKCAIGNTPSRNIPRKLGFRLEGIERAGELHKNRFLDLEVYSLLRTEWSEG
jgi:ribosomal-protein-serine acetyltransferase